MKISITFYPALIKQGYRRNKLLVHVFIIMARYTYTMGIPKGLATERKILIIYTGVVLLMLHIPIPPIHTTYVIVNSKESIGVNCKHFPGRPPCMVCTYLISLLPQRPRAATHSEHNVSKERRPLHAVDRTKVGIEPIRGQRNCMEIETCTLHPRYARTGLSVWAPPGNTLFHCRYHN